MALLHTSGDVGVLELFELSGRTVVRSAALLRDLLADWPERPELAAELVEVEHEGDRIAHDIIHLLHDGRTARKALDPLEGLQLATTLDDIVDNAEQTADMLGIYHVEATMEHASLLAEVLVAAGEQVAGALRALRAGGDLMPLPRRDPPARERGRPPEPRRDRLAVRRRDRPDGRDPLEGHLRVARGGDRRVRAGRARARGHRHQAPPLTDADGTRAPVPCGAVTVPRPLVRLLAPFALCGLLAAGCGGSDEGGAKPPPGVSKQDFTKLLAEASTATKADFPATEGRSLQQMADQVQAGPQVGFASSLLTPGTNRLAFGVIDKSNNFVYGKSAVYIAKDPADPALGPFPAPADSLVTKPAFRSQNAAVDSSPIAQIYAADVRSRRPATWNVLVVTKQGDRHGRRARAGEGHRDAPRRRSPTSGSVPPRVSTDTVASAAGNLAAIDTRRPFARELHETNFKDVRRKEARRAPVRDAAAVPVARVRAGRRHRAADASSSSATGWPSSTRRSIATTR